MFGSFTRIAREWSILLFGAVAIIGALTFAAYHGTPDTGRVEQAGSDGDRQSRQSERSGQLADSAPRDKRPQQEQAQPRVRDGRPPAQPRENTAAAQSPPAHDHRRAEQGSAPANQSGQRTTAAPRRDAETSGQGEASVAHTATAGDAALGRQVYRKCQACHSIEAGKNTLGPSLAGIVGKKAGEVANYNYSPALKNADVVWDAKTLDAYLADPQKFIPGNKMPFPGLKSENERAGVIAYLATTAAPQAGKAASGGSSADVAARAAPPPRVSSTQPGEDDRSAVGYIPDVRYTLRSAIAEGRMVYIGVGGAIDGAVNPILSAAEGQVVQITLINGEGAEHDIVFPDQQTRSPRITGKGTSTTIVFRAQKSGDYIYFCSVPGHQQAGMQGQFLVTPRPPQQMVVEADISQLAADVPPPVGNRGPQTVRVDLVAVELEGRLAEGTTFGYWTFNGRVPGPMLRVRVGDTVEVRVKNAADSTMIHSVDFHAATGPGGGAAATQVDPGQEKSFKFKALSPGLYVYHCATPMVAHHIANGMYGLILVEPEGGLPRVDREYYVMQGEIYTEAPFGQRGSQEFSVEKLLNERPEYFVFNGAVGALSKLHPLEAKVGETVRIYFGVGGPNHTSSFHVIGEIFDRVYSFGDILSPAARGVQTTTVPAGGAAIVEFKLDVPGNYILVDHALSRAERGLVGMLHVEGPPNPEIFDGNVEPGGGH